MLNRVFVLIRLANLTAVILICVSSASPATAALNVGPYLQMPRPDEMTVMWETTTETVGSVRFGAPGNLDRVAREEKSAKIHEIKLTGLQPGTTYGYTIHWDSESAGPFEFKSAPPPGTTKVRLAAYGDSRSNNEVHARCAKVMQDSKPDVVINSGDLVSSGRIYEQWKPQFFDPLSSLISNVPILTILGNHENDSKFYYDFFSLPGNERWWSLDFGFLHLVGLNSQKPFDPSSEQYKWLENDLKSVPPGRWIIVTVHAPLFSAHPYREIVSIRWDMQPIFQKYGVDLVIAGHDHHYARCYPIGPVASPDRSTVQHFTSGGGGAGLYPVFDWPWIETANQTHNVMILDFEGDQVRIHAYSDQGERIDDVTIARDRPAPVERFVAYDAILWEHALAKKVAEADPVEITDSAIRAKIDWTFDSTFPIDMKLSAKWEYGPEWKIDGAKNDFLLNKGGQVTIGAGFASNWPKCYPTPKLTFTLTDVEGKRLFRNNVFEVHPIRVWARHEIVAARKPDNFEADGEPTEWKDIPEVSQFVTDKGDRLAPVQARVRVARDADNLYVLALVDMADDRVFDKGEFLRDDKDILMEDESFAVYLGNESRTYTFAVNTKNRQFDARRQDAKFNAKWTSAVAKVAAQWYVEMEIPLRQLEEEKLDRINFSHTDGATEERSEWSATFGRPIDAARYGYLK